MNRNGAALLCLGLVVCLLNSSPAREPEEITCTGKVVDAQGRPIAEAKVTAYEMHFDGIAGNFMLHQAGDVTTAQDGAFTFTTDQKPEKSLLYQCYIVAAKQDLALGWTIWKMREDLKSNIQLGEPVKLEGVIVDEAGKPVASAEVRVNFYRTVEVVDGEEKNEWLGGIAPLQELGTRTNSQGRFSFSNLPAALGVDLLVMAAGKATTYTRTTLGEPAFKTGQTDVRVVLPDEARIEGRIVDPDTGKGIAQTRFAVVGGNLFYYRFVHTTDDDGTFSIGGLLSSKYLIRGEILPRTYVNAKSGETTKATIQANKPYYGRILFEDGSPVVIKPEPWPRAETRINLVEDERTNGRSIVDIDEEGYLKVYLSQEQYQKLQSRKAWFEVYIPDIYTSVDERRVMRVETVFAIDLLATDKTKAGVAKIPKPRREPDSLVGKSLPELKALEIDLPQTAIQSKRLLVCFFDINQRPSRNCIMQLSKQEQGLTAQGVEVVAVQTSKVDGDELNKWIKENNIQFPVGMIEADDEKTRFIWSVRALPWLILTDKKHIVQAEGFGINELDVQVESKELVAETGSIEVRVTAESNGRPLEGARVSFTNTETNEDFVVLTNEKGIARIDLMLGDYSMTNVSKEDYTSHKQVVLMIVESDKVNRIDIDLAEAPKITGYVRDQNGKGVEGAYVQMVPSGPRNRITDANGKFEFRWDPRTIQLFLVARHIKRDLAGSMQFRTGDMGVEIKVGPGLVLTGRVADSNGTGIPEAWVEAKILTGRGAAAIAETKVNSNGQYWINALPTGHRYFVQAGREGYGEVFKELGQKPIHRTSVQVETIVLNVANLSISGVVEDANGNTVKEATVKCWGNGQPKLQTTITDAEGKFIIQNVCKGPLRIQAAKDRLNKAIDAEGGKDNIRIVLPAKPFFIGFGPPTAAKTRSLLAGKILPQLGAIDINFNAKEAKGANILVCFFDMNQRPSRVCILQLARRVEELKRKSVTVVAIHAVRINEKTLDEWVKKNNMAFPVGMIQGDVEKTRFTWGVRGLPWLILTDKEQIVRAEGFGVNELDEKIAALREK